MTRIRTALSFVAVGLLVAACSNSTTANNTPPAIFSANTTSTRFDGATIEWTQSNDPDGDPVRYAVFLNGAQVTSGLTALTYSFTGLTPETSYTGRVEASDGNGGVATANFSFTTEPELIIQTIDVTIIERTSGTTFNIDAIFQIMAVQDAKTYEIEVLEMNPNSIPSQIGKKFTWTPTTDQHPLVKDSAGNFQFFLDYGGAANVANSAAIAQLKAFYAGVTGRARVTITVGN